MTRPSRRLRLRRSAALVLVVAVVFVAGLVIQRLPGDWTLTTEQKGMVGASISEPSPEPESLVVFDRKSWRLGESGERGDHGQRALETQTRILFEHALVLMQAGQYAQAIKALEMVITVAPWMPEAFVNLGFALYEVGEFDAARGAFLRAVDLNPAQGNAYYGAAIAYEALGDVGAALGAMRTYLHITEGQEQFKSRARAAIWEWESSLVTRAGASQSASGLKNSAK